MRLKTRVTSARNEGVPATPNDLNRVAMLPSIKSAETGTRDEVDISSNVNLNFLEKLIALQYLMARFNRSQFKQ